MAPEALQLVGFAGEILPLLAVRADGVRRGDLLPFPAAEGGSQHAGADHDAPAIGRRIADGDIDPADANRPLAHLNHNFPVVCLIDNRIPRAAPQNVGDVIEAACPSTGSRDRRRRGGRGGRGGHHERGQFSTSC